MLAERVEDIEGLLALCRSGQLYEVERWIAEGKPLQLDLANVRRRERRTLPMQIAIKQRNHALALVLLVNGYRLDLDSHCPLEAALDLRAEELIELFFAWGADLKRVYPYSILETYQSKWYERFAAAGVDLTKHHAMVAILGSVSENKPLYGGATDGQQADNMINLSACTKEVFTR